MGGSTVWTSALDCEPLHTAQHCQPCDSGQCLTCVFPVTLQSQCPQAARDWQETVTTEEATFQAKLPTCPQASPQL